MIYNLIGSSILVAVGAAGMWAWMRVRLSLAVAALADAEVERRSWIKMTCDAAVSAIKARNELVDARATNARLSDTVGQLQYKRDKTLEYCKQFRVRGAVVAGILSGEQDQ